MFCSRRTCGRRKLLAFAWLVVSLYILTLISPVRFTREIVSTANPRANEIVLRHNNKKLRVDIKTHDQQNHWKYNVTKTEDTHTESEELQHNRKDADEAFHEQSTIDSSQRQFNHPLTDRLLNVLGTNNPRTDNDLVSEEASLSLAYTNKWVGFRDIDGQNCQQALYSSTDNKLFPPHVKRISNERIITDSKDCKSFRRNYGYNRYPKVSDEEKNFPIAFIILFHSNLDQVMFLLRAIYRPHNVYCLSVDANTGSKFIETVKSVTQCLPNVFLASKLEKIVYAGFSRLMADFDCMEDLLKRPEPWKYVINMPGQQFPLRTNLELVKILTMFNGSNDIEGAEEKMTCVKNRHLYKHIYTVNNKTGKVEVVKTEERNSPPPHGLVIVKGSTYGTFSRAFVQFALHNPIARDFLEWNKNVLSPDEYFWSTLHHSSVLHVPGGVHDNKKQAPFITSFSVWKGNNQTCASKFVRKICILSPEDLANIVKQNSLFVNKFYIRDHPAALHCMDQWIMNRTFAGTVIDLAVYNREPSPKVHSLGST